MAWVDVPGSNSVWQYENSATISNTYKDSADGSYQLALENVKLSAPSNLAEKMKNKNALVRHPILILGF